MNASTTGRAAPPVARPGTPIDRSACPSRRRHGTRLAYMNDGCRCPDAREQHRIYRKRLRENRQQPAFVPADGTIRRLRALAAIGWTNAELAARLHVTKIAVGWWRAARYERVHRDTARRIAALYEQLSAVPGPSSRARVYARRAGWVPPLLWEGVDIDDPAAQPMRDRGRRRGRQQLVHLDDVEFLRRSGLTREQIARRLGVEVESIERAEQRRAAATRATDAA